MIAHQVPQPCVTCRSGGCRIQFDDALEITYQDVDEEFRVTDLVDVLVEGQWLGRADSLDLGPGLRLVA